VRIFEILIAIVLLVVLVVRWIPVIKNKGIVRVLPWTAALLIPVQIVFEGYRWQMVPLYGMAMVFAVIRMLLPARNSGNEYFIRILIPLVQHFDGCSSIMIPWYSKGPRG